MYLTVGEYDLRPLFDGFMILITHLEFGTITIYV